MLNGLYTAVPRILVPFTASPPLPVSCLALEARNTGLTLLDDPALTNTFAVNPYAGSFVGVSIVLTTVAVW